MAKASNREVIDSAPSLGSLQIIGLPISKAGIRVVKVSLMG